MIRSTPNFMWLDTDHNFITALVPWAKQTSDNVEGFVSIEIFQETYTQHPTDVKRGGKNTLSYLSQNDFYKYQPKLPKS